MGVKSKRRGRKRKIAKKRNKYRIKIENGESKIKTLCYNVEIRKTEIMKSKEFSEISQENRRNVDKEGQVSAIEEDAI